MTHRQSAQANDPGWPSKKHGKKAGKKRKNAPPKNRAAPPADIGAYVKNGWW